MDLDDIKRGLRAEIKKREKEQYATFQCNVRQMCKDVLAKLEEQESVIAEKDKQIDLYKRGWKDCDRNNAFLYKQLRHANYKRCLAMAKLSIKDDYLPWNMKWHYKWQEFAEKFKESK